MEERLSDIGIDFDVVLMLLHYYIVDKIKIFIAIISLRILKIQSHYLQIKRASVFGPRKVMMVKSNIRNNDAKSATMRNMIPKRQDDARSLCLNQSAKKYCHNNEIILALFERSRSSKLHGFLPQFGCIRSRLHYVNSNIHKSIVKDAQSNLRKLLHIIEVSLKNSSARCYRIKVASLLGHSSEHFKCYLRTWRHVARYFRFLRFLPNPCREKTWICERTNFPSVPAWFF